MAETTTRYGLGLLAAGQAQKEIGHNESLIRVDALLHATAESRSETVPPAGPDEGLCWIVAVGATGDWAGHSDQLAVATAGGWRFVNPREGMLVWVKTDTSYARFGAYGWIYGDWAASALTVGGQKVVGARGAAVASPGGGTMIDSEARAALTAVLERLREHGLIEG